ncbi:GH3 auxin-responsive promoter family protein [Paraflavisolibacter sp. H34]|uniref:GH3 family domain-containing protein n=1 Tax=Huijunlia imazamoxiresistens TaxID=3127457 RepID=UPI003019592E
MSLLTALQQAYWQRFAPLLRQNSREAPCCQQAVLRQLLRQGRSTLFGKDHHFAGISTHNQFCQAVPLRSYEELQPYLDRILEGWPSVLWPGRPRYLGKTSGTTGTPKYLPVTGEGIGQTQMAARYLLANLSLRLEDPGFMGSKVLHLSDPHLFEQKAGFLCGSISAIKSRHIPFWAAPFSLPGKPINRVADPSERLRQTISSLQGERLHMAVGLPIWWARFLEAFEQQTGKRFGRQFPRFRVLFVTGMNYGPYRDFFSAHMGKDFQIMENYSATEGNFAFQDRLSERGMLLLANQGVFYEFIPLGEVGSSRPRRLLLPELQAGEKYVPAVSTVNGLWAYKMNDVVEIVSVHPFRLLVCGRLKDLFSPFGEHLLPLEAETAITEACRRTGNILKNFVVTPVFFDGGRPGHRWWIALEGPFREQETFCHVLNEALCRLNTNYKDLSQSGAIALPLVEQVPERLFLHLAPRRQEPLSLQWKQSRFCEDPALIARLEGYR